MSKVNDGGPAFPADNESNVNGTIGMSLRDYFAGQVLQGILSSTEAENDFEEFSDALEHYSRVSYEYADAMLKERTRNG